MNERSFKEGSASRGIMWGLRKWEELEGPRSVEIQNSDHVLDADGEMFFLGCTLTLIFHSLIPRAINILLNFDKATKLF
jgi:hypothetical protein